MKRWVALAVITAMCLCLFAGCEEEPLSHSVTAMDTVCSISLYDNKSEELLDACVALLAAREDLWSKTKENSEIAGLNAANGETVTISADTSALLQTAQFYTMVTEGAFDVTVSSLCDLWAKAEAENTLPSQEAIDATLMTVGAEWLTVDGESAALSGGASVDLGGIAKGKTADDLVTLLKAGDCSSAVIDLGGNIVAHGSKPNGQPFKIGIADPRDPSAIIATVAVSDRAVVTSGSYQRQYHVADRTYSHIIDPQSGLPVDNDLLSVTIIAPQAVDADVLSTACFVMGYEKATTFLQNFDDIEAVFVKSDGTVVATDGAELI